MIVTPEQQKIYSLALRPDIPLIKVNAVSGAGKTFTLVEIVKLLKPENGLYIAFNKPIAEEARTKFPEEIDCRTVDSLAWQYVIKGQRTLDFFTYKCFSEDIPYDMKLHVMNAMDSFFNSAEVSLDYFKQYPQEIADLCYKYINRMITGETDATFGFAKKYFHLMLHNEDLTFDKPYDIIMLDECGDTTGVILEIFKLLPAKKKLMVGDPEQNIYSFMDTIDGFSHLKDEGYLCNLSQSFRVSTNIARRVETFCKHFLNKDMEFKGTDHNNPTCETIAYISRTNASLIARMVTLSRDKTYFSLTRDPKEIFALPFVLMNLKPDCIIYDKRYKYLKDEYDLYHRTPNLQSEHSSFRAYLRAHFPNDVPLKSAINLLAQYSYGTIYETYNYVKDMKYDPCVTLTTAHACKGLEYDTVYIEDDLNSNLPEIISTEEDLAEYRLYYVACTRAKHELFNAQRLETSKYGSILYTEIGVHGGLLPSELVIGENKDDDDEIDLRPIPF